MGLRTGTIVYVGSLTGTVGTKSPLYEGGQAGGDPHVGRDIVNAGTPLGTFAMDTEDALGWFGQYYSAEPNAPLRPTRNTVGHHYGQQPDRGVAATMAPR